MLAAALAVIVMATGCAGAPPIRCDDQGLIVIPPGTPIDVQAEWQRRNMDLISRRSQRSLGRLPWATPASLAKAEGCP